MIINIGSVIQNIHCHKPVYPCEQRFAKKTRSDILLMIEIAVFDHKHQYYYMYKITIKRDCGRTVNRVVLTTRLSAGTEHMDVHRRVNVLHDWSDIAASYFITREDGALLPVSPKQGSITQGQSKRVGQNLLPRHYLPMVFAIIITAGNVLDFGISPVDFVVCIVDGQTIGPMNIFVNYNGPSLSIAIHTCTLYLWHFAPVRPKHPSKKHKMRLLKIVT